MFDPNLSRSNPQLKIINAFFNNSWCGDISAFGGILLDSKQVLLQNKLQAEVPN